jgi:hypothetical protein
MVGEREREKTEKARTRASGAVSTLDLLVSFDVLGGVLQRTPVFLNSFEHLHLRVIGGHLLTGRWAHNSVEVLFIVLIFFACLSLIPLPTQRLSCGALNVMLIVQGLVMFAPLALFRISFFKSAKL